MPTLSKQQPPSGCCMRKTRRTVAQNDSLVEIGISVADTHL